MSNLRVLVVGASIAGPSAAYWFARAGCKVTVIERFPALRIGGQNVDIRNVGVTVMNKITGLEPTIRANLVPIEGICAIRDDGSPFATMKQTGDPNQQSLVSEYEIYRGDLARVLVDLTKENENVEYIFNEQVSALNYEGRINSNAGSDQDGPVTVQFLNGTPSREYDLVVACDGSTSRTRALAFESTVREHIKPVNAFAAFFSINKDLLNGSRMGRFRNATGGRFMAVGADSTPGVNRVSFIGVFPGPYKSGSKTKSGAAGLQSKDDDDLGDNTTLPFREAASKGTDSLKEFVADWFRGTGWETDTILEEMKTSEDFYASEMVQVKLPSLHRGRVVFVGDAGYAGGPTGNGSSLAMAGAYLLAGEINRHHQLAGTAGSNDDGIAAALKAYEEAMKPILADLQKIPPGIPGILAPQTWWGLLTRNVVFTLVTWVLRLGPYFTWVPSLFAASMGGGDKYHIPDYEWEREHTRTGRDT